jgi:glycosyltransferase involved in cell wall biosynthesis
MKYQRKINKEISFIIPTLNEEAHIGGVLDSIRENVEGRLGYEIIVVDNGSCDRTVEIACKKGAVCFVVPECSISSLRNAGASEATSDIFVFLDGDVYLGKDWGKRIMSVIKRLYSQPNIITGSLYGISDENNWIERIWFAPRVILKEVNYINGGHLIIIRSLFSKVGGFDSEMQTGEDYEFCARAKRSGALIENDPELKVVHAGYPKSIKSFFARERWHARGDYKSFKTLVSSKPALLSLINLLMAIICTIGVTISSQPWFAFPSVYILFLASVSVAASIHRYSGKLDSGRWGTIFLYMVYFSARTVSMVDVVIQSFLEKRLAGWGA